MKLYKCGNKEIETEINMMPLIYIISCDLTLA